MIKKLFQGPLYDYTQQKWVDIDTAQDRIVKDDGKIVVYSHNGVLYEVKKGTDQYRNYRD